MKTVASIEDLKKIAKKKVPRPFFQYVENGSYEGLTLRANRSALDAIALRQRVMIDVSDRDLSGRFLGENATLPVALAPCGLTGAIYPNGEIHAARAAETFGVPFALTTMSIDSIEDVSAATNKPFWFQLYLLKDLGITADLIGRADAAGCTALVLTLDRHVQGVRYRDVKNGLGIPPSITLGSLWSVVTKPRWALGMLRSKHITFGNLKQYAPGGMSEIGDWIEEQFDWGFDWHHVAWVRGEWPHKLIVKGILDATDAKLAVETGADAIIVSNHGGRQLDGAQSTAEMLPNILKAVDGRIEVYVDSGIRSGMDVLKMLGLGADGCLIGRAYLYGLGAYGEAGVKKALELIRDQLDVAMALTGTTKAGCVSADVIQHRRPTSAFAA